MEIIIRCIKCNREINPAWVSLPKEMKFVGLIDGDCHCGKINTAWQGVCELATVYGREAVIRAAEGMVRK